MAVIEKFRRRGIASTLIKEIENVCNEGCEYIQFDEPVWTENVSESDWGADVLNYIINKFPGIKFNLHICGVTDHRKRVYFGRYTDMFNAFKKLKIDEIHLEHCSLHYPMLDIFNDWQFSGSLSAGVVDQRIDSTESIENIEHRKDAQGNSAQKDMLSSSPSFLSDLFVKKTLFRGNILYNL